MILSFKKIVADGGGGSAHILKSQLNMFDAKVFVTFCLSTGDYDID